MPDSLGPILAVTVIVPELDGASAAYRSLLGVEQLASGNEGGRRWALLGPTEAQWGLVRLVEVPEATRPAAFRTLGWAALEILVADADATFDRCLKVDGFDVLQKPSAVGSSGGLRAFQVTGPGGEGVYLTQIVRSSDRFSLPALGEGEHRVYVAVVGTHDIQSTRGFFESTFRVPMVTDHPLPVKVLNQAYGLPHETRHRISTLQLAGRTLIEIDEYPTEAITRPSGSGGVASVTFAGRKPSGRMARRLPKRNQPPYRGAPAWDVMGPFGLHLEVVCL